MGQNNNKTQLFIYLLGHVNYVSGVAGFWTSSTVIVGCHWQMLSGAASVHVLIENNDIPVCDPLYALFC